MSDIILGTKNEDILLKPPFISPQNVSNEHAERKNVERRQSQGTINSSHVEDSKVLTKVDHFHH